VSYSSGYERFGITDSEFCWRGPQVHKPWVTKLTCHGVSPVLKRAKPSAECEPQKVGDLPSRLPAQQQFLVSLRPRQSPDRETQLCSVNTRSHVGMNPRRTDAHLGTSRREGTKRHHDPIGDDACHVRDVGPSWSAVLPLT